MFQTAKGARHLSVGKGADTSVGTARPSSSTFQDALQIGLEILAELGMTQRILDGCAQIADLAAAVVASPAERPDIDRLVLEQRRDTVGQLDLAAGAAAGALELVEDRRRQDIAADDGEIRRRFLRARLLDDLLDTLAAGCIGRDAYDTVIARLVTWNGLHAEHRAAVALELVVHLLQARHIAVDQVVGEMHEERLVADG